MIKLLIFFLCLPISTFAFSSLNMNSIFKKSKEKEARIFTIILIGIFNNLFTDLIYWIFLLFKR